MTLTYRKQARKGIDHTSAGVVYAHHFGSGFQELVFADHASAARWLAAQLGASIECDHTGSVYTIHVDAPDGQQWVDGSVTAMRIEARPTTAADKAALWQDAINRMNEGLMEAD